jgi:hypothetical protein
VGQSIKRELLKRSHANEFIAWSCLGNMVFTGMPRNETLAVRLTDIDLDAPDHRQPQCRA